MVELVEHRRPAWLWPGQGHCALDKELRRSFGITCGDYERLLALQGGRCALCGLPPRPARRLDVDHDHDPPYAIRGLLHRPCNRRVAVAIVRYLMAPPGGPLGLAVPAKRIAALERRRQQKRAAARARRAAAAAEHPQTPTQTQTGRVAEQFAHALGERKKEVS